MGPHLLCCLPRRHGDSVTTVRIGAHDKIERPSACRPGVSSHRDSSPRRLATEPPAFARCAWHAHAMRVTKHEHACLVIEQDGETLVVDPGGFTSDLDDLENVVGVVVTHEHPDHWTPAHLSSIAERFPGAPIYTTRATAATAPVDATVVAAGDRAQAGAFQLRFFGGTHNEFHSSISLFAKFRVPLNAASVQPLDSYSVLVG